jgi:hypothetical protein
MKHFTINRGFIQISILIAIVLSLAVLSSIGYFAYEAGQRSPTNTQKTTNETGDVTETEATSTPIENNKEEKMDTVEVQPKTVEEASSVSNTPTAPVKSNLDSTCLSFYAKMKSLDVLPTKEPPVYTPAESKAIQMASQGEYTPALDSALAEESAAQNLYLNTLDANNIQKQNLATEYAFCYEYLAETYGLTVE